MQNIVIAKPYVFVPPHRGTFWAKLFALTLPNYLRKSFGVTDVAVRGVDERLVGTDERQGPEPEAQERRGQGQEQHGASRAQGRAGRRAHAGRDRSRTRRGGEPIESAA